MSGVLRFYDNTVDQTSGTVLAKAEFKNDRGLYGPASPSMSPRTSFRTMK